MLWPTARAARVNPPAMLDVEAGHYQVVPAGQVFCAGIVPLEGFEVVHALLRPWLPLAQGYRYIENYLQTLGLPIQALCGMELRVPAQMTFDAFRTFNGPYVEQLRKWDLVLGNYSAVCRTNVVPAFSPPGEPAVHAFSFVAAASGKATTFCVSGTADINPQGKVVAGGSTSPAAMKEKLQFVLQVIGDRLSEMGFEWNDVTHADLHFVADAPEAWASILLPVIGNGALSGVRVHYARPPIVGSEVELEVRAIARELVLHT
ncbi:MAG: hypothetical protein C5B46_03500 [Proteobacteria bacterium]|nr:MAG: hypothetical protein C5B46_03500 [Pseudomonadota bacterium]